MDAVIHVNAAEFNEHLFRRIQSLIAGDEAITISISSDDRLARAIENVENGANLTSLSLEEYDALKKQLTASGE